MKSKENLIDLSDIKDNELDKTASFTDLMSRSERKKRENEKKKREKKNNILDNLKIDDDNNITINGNIEDVSKVESVEETLSQTKKYEELTQTLSKDVKLSNDNYSDDELDHDNKFGSGLLIVNILFLLAALCMFVYLVIFTVNLNRRKFLYIDASILSGMFFLFGISLISNKKISKFFTFLNIISFICFCIFNSLLYLNYIK